MNEITKQIKFILNHAINSVKPETLIKQSVSFDSNYIKIPSYIFNVNDYENIFVIGFGKASAAMASSLENILGNHIADGMVITKYGYSMRTKKIKVKEAGHPVVDINGIEATKELVDFVKRTGKNDLVIVLISGGGSALLETLPENIEFEDFRNLNKLLLNCGATINEINVVRKSISSVKGGKLARIIYPSEILNIIISDIIDDPVEDIASGPTVKQIIKNTEALKILKKYSLIDKISASIVDYLQMPENSFKVPEIKITNIIIGNNKLALKDASEKAKYFGFNTYLISDKIQGEARIVGKEVAGLIKSVIAKDEPVKKPACILFGGETTVTVTGKGKGGRNQELVLAALLELQNVKAEFSFLSCGTDGTDGPTDAAGALINNHSWKLVGQLNLNPGEFLINNDSYNFFDKINGLIKTGPTGTNVMDIGIALIK